MGIKGLKKKRPIWVRVAAKGLMRVSMGVATLSIALDEKTIAFVGLGCGFLADMFDEYFILRTQEIEEEN